MGKMGNMGNFWSKHKKKLRLTGLGVLSVAVLSVGVQLAYPANRTLPGQRIGGESAGFQNTSGLKDRLAAGQKVMQLNIEAGDKHRLIKWKELGINVNDDATVNDALAYSWQQRLVPFSALYKVLARDVSITTRTDDAALRSYAERISGENYKSPANASLSIKGTEVVRNIQKSGYKYEPAQIAQQIKAAPYKKGTTVKLAGADVPPAFTQTEIEATAKKAEAIIANGLRVEAGITPQTVPAAEIASWLKFKETTDAQHLAIDTDQEKVKAYISGLNKNVYRAPGAMTITLRDGKELQRTPDTSGQSLDLNNGASALSARALENSTVAVKLPIMKLPPKIAYQRSYTKSQAGLSALLNDIVAEEGDMAASLRALDGSGIVASTRGSKQYDPASTYKLPLAYSVLKRVEAGTLQWSDNIQGSRNAEKCLSDMIILSDNPCGTAFGDKLGWQAVTDDARAIGMGRTNLAKGFVSTSDDQALFLANLQSGQLVNGANRDLLLNLMKQQKYRSGIPAGTGGAVVADKVGFMGGILHDSAIVYGPQGAYVLVIYSNKSSWARLAGSTAKIHALMNQ